MRPTVVASTIAWLVVPVAAVAGIFVLCDSGLYVGSQQAIDRFVVCVVACGVLVALRRPTLVGLRWLFDHAGAPWLARVLVDALVVVACAVLTTLSLELAYANEGVISVLDQYLALEVGLVALLLLVLLLAFQGSGVGVALGCAALTVVGIAQYFVMDFKSYVIMPSDLAVLGTAAAVAGGYVYEVGDQLVYAASLLLVAVGIASLAQPPERLERRGVIARAAGALGCAALLAASLVVPSYADDFGIQVSAWDPLGSYHTYGFIPSFVKLTQSMTLQPPEGYTEQGARELAERYAQAYDEGPGAEAARVAAEQQFAEIQPALVVIVDESFSDLSAFSGETWGYAGPTRYKALGDALMRGSLSVSTAGGGTCNTEFELLCGVSLGFVGQGVYPFSFFDLSEVPSLPRQFDALGYTTTAMHPNLATNYNRAVVYPDLGFEEFLDIDDFEGASWYHSGVSDAQTFSRVLELLQADAGPQLIYDLTMQNHSAYNQNNLGEIPHYAVSALDESSCAELSEYVACVEETDRALDEFLNALRGLDRPVAVLFLGDHQSYVGQWLNDALYPDEGEPDHTRRIYQTTWCLWANYDVAGNDQVSAQVDASASNVVALALHALGAPLTDLQKAQVVTYNETASMNALGVGGTDGTWVAISEEDEFPESYRDLEQITYLEFGENV